MKIGFINKSFPPISSATGYHAFEMAKAIYNTNDLNPTISFWGTTTKQTLKQDNDKRFKWSLHRISYSGKRKALRLFFNFIDSFRLVWRAKYSNQDVYIVLSDPPFIQFWATFLLRSDKTIFWMMDIYPDAFEANGLVKPKNVLYRFFQSRLKNYKPYALITLGAHQTNYLKKYFPQSQFISLPIGIINNKKPLDNAPPYWYNDGDKIYISYSGNLGEAHDINFLQLIIQNCDQAKYHFIFSCKGSKSSEFYEWLKDQQCDNVIIKDHLSWNDLKYLDIQIVTLLPDWTHICVPSKAITSTQYGSCILFGGKKESDTWHYVEECSWIIEPSKNKSQKVKELIDSIDKKVVFNKKKKTLEVFEKLQSEYDRGLQIIISLLNSEKIN